MPKVTDRVFSFSSYGPSAKRYGYAKAVCLFSEIVLDMLVFNRLTVIHRFFIVGLHLSF